MLSLAIGIAATTAIFSVANGVLLRPVPGVGRPERLVEIAQDVGGLRADVSFAAYEVLRQQRSVLDDVAAFVTQSVSVAADEQGSTPAVRRALIVSPNYFSMLGIQPVRGRRFTESETRLGAGARRGWPSSTRRWRVACGRTSTPLGNTSRSCRHRHEHRSFSSSVSRDAQRLSASATSENFYYVPAAQVYNSAVVLHARVRPGLANAVSASMRDAFRRIDPSLPVRDVRPLDDALDTYLMPQRFAAWVSGSLGTFGLLLALIGIYGTTAFLVSRRAREMAIRMALGATDGDVLRLLLRSAGGPHRRRHARDVCARAWSAAHVTCRSLAR